jgi:hypothetical protein
MTDTWAPGDRGRVTGPLSGEAVVEEVLDFDAIKVRISFFGRATVTTVRPDQFVGEGGERRGLPPPTRELRRSLAALDARLGPGKGAGHDELDELRRRLSPCSLPEDFATVLSWRAGGLRLGRNTELVGPASVAELKAMMDGHGAAGRFADWRPGEWWNAGWIPFTREPDEGTAMLVLDTAGTFGGQPGQILAWDRHPARPVVAESLAALFAAWCEGLERGIVEAAGGVLAPVSGQEPRWERFRGWLQPSLPRAGRLARASPTTTSRRSRATGTAVSWTSRTRGSPTPSLLSSNVSRLSSDSTSPAATGSRGGLSNGSASGCPGA